MDHLLLSFRQKCRHAWSAVRRWWQGTDPKQPTIFHSARLKLTFFYLAVLVCFGLTLTLSLRFLALREYNHANIGERGIVQRLLFNQYSVPPQQPTMFNQYQVNQDHVVHRQLNDDIILINFAVLVLGGLLSYWYAGRALKPIEDAHQAQARFAADASHELRTPLASLRVENEVFLRQKNFTHDQAKELIASNLDEVQRLDALAGSLLALTQYEHVSLHLGTVKIAKLVDTAVQQMGIASSQKHVAIETHIEPVSVLGDAESLVQLITIVLDNAVKYGPEKSAVHINGNRQNNNYFLSVRDEGPGIAPADLPHIFERLYRGDKARGSKIGGYGLGLSLAQEIVYANRASIKAWNHPEGGAVFTITLNIT
jgi:signal transduction histidine kinase